MFEDSGHKYTTSAAGGTASAKLSPSTPPIAYLMQTLTECSDRIATSTRRLQDQIDQFLGCRAEPSSEQAEDPRGFNVMEQLPLLRLQLTRLEVQIDRLSQ